MRWNGGAGFIKLRGLDFGVQGSEGVRVQVFGV